MYTQYEALVPPRYRIELHDGVEQIVIPAWRNIFLMVFLAAWLVGWSVGGATTAYQLVFKPMAAGPTLFLAAWMVGWALGEGFVLYTIAWMLGGFETVRGVAGGLEVGWTLFGLGRRRVFRGEDIRNLRASATSYGRGESQPCVKFDYGAKTIAVATGCSEAECRMIIDRLRGNLPKSAIAV